MHEYDLSKMQELLHDFYNLTGIKICIYDSAENELCYYPEKLTPFCRALREDAAADGRCRACDRRAFAECKRTHRRAVYTCHAGLLECFSPILYNDKIIGYIVIGQIRAESAPAEELPADLRALYAQLPAIGMDKINSAIHILDACAGYEYVKTLVSGYDERIDARMAAYIEEHLAGDLSVAALCRAFRLSRSELYLLFREYFSASVADFVKARRLQTACRLLEKTRLPVGKIAEQCGIPDYNYFSKQFKAAFRLSPTQWRQSRSLQGAPQSPAAPEQENVPNVLR